MDEEKIQNDIDATVAQSPVKAKEEAARSMSFPAAPDGQTTLVTGDIEGNVADQIVDTPDRGIAFDPNSTEVYTGGTALPNLNYNTRRQTAADRGNPLYFEPNYQPVVPFDVNTPYGNVSSTTLDPEKLAWQVATSVAGRHDDEYIGYKRMPRAGSLGWGSHWLGVAKQFTYNLVPELTKGGASLAAGTPAAAFRRVNAIEKDYLADMYGMQFDDGEERKPSVLAAGLRAKGFKPSEEDKQEHLARLEEGTFWADGYQYVQDQVNDSMNWAEAHYGNTLVADFLDKSGKAATAAGVASGMVNFGAALLSRNPKAVFTLLNFAAQNDMRKNALNAGVSPMWADAYSIGGSALNSALDMFQFEAITGGFALTRKAVYEMMAKEGAYKFHLGRAIGKNALDLFVVEPGTEMVQESIEGAYDPEFLEDPADRLAVAAISAMALKAIMLPSAVRHAKAEERLAVAQALGVDVQYLSIVKDATATLDDWVKQGKLDASRRDEVMEMILSRAPDQIAAEIRTGVLGQLNKVSPKERQEFAEMLTNVDKNSITMKEFNALDVRVDESLKNLDVSSDMKTLVKGIVCGLAALKLAQDGTAPNQIQIPNFVITNKDASSYSAKTNTIELSTQWSNTEFTKVRGSQTSDFNSLVSSSFIPSTTQSDRMSSLIHELGHWVDYQIGEKGFGDFLEHYYNNIARVFGNEKALNVYNASKQGAKRYGVSRRGDYTSENNATEYMAQSLSRLGKRSAEYFGLGKSKAARFLSYANIMFNQMSEWDNASGIKRNTNVLGSFQTAMQEVAKHNMDVIKDLVNAFGEEGIKQALRDFLNQTENPNEDFAEYLARHDMLKQLFDVMDSFADAAGTEQIGRLFDSQEQIENFVTQGDTYFNTGYDNEVEAVKQRRAEAAQKAAQKAGTAPATTTAKNNVKQVTLSNGQTVSVPKNVQNFGGDKGIDAVRKLLKGNNEAIENERMSGWHGTKWLFDQFKLLMSGKGEGGMAHGYGIYVTTEKHRAKHYWHDIALRDNQIPIYFDVEFWDGEGWRKEKIPLKGDGALHEAFMKWYNLHAQKHSDKDDILWYTKGRLVENGELSEQLVDSSAEVGAGNNLIKYIKLAALLRSDEQLTNIDISIDGDFGQLMQIMTPDTDLMLHEGAKRNAQPPKVDEILTAMRPEIESMLTQFYKGQQAKDPDLWSDKDVANNVRTDLDDYDSSNGRDIYNVVERGVMGVNGITNRYDAARQASKFLSDHGIMGNFYFGNVDGMSAVVFDPATLEIMDIIRNHEDIEVADRIANPNDYIVGTDPVTEIQQAFEQGKNDPVDETPSYDVEVDGRKLGEDIAGLTQGIMKRAKNLPNKIVKWAASSPWGWGLDRIMITMFGRDVAEKLDVGGKYTQRNALRSGMFNRLMKNLEPIIGNIETDNRAAMFKYKTMLNQLGFVRVKDVEINNPVVPELSNKRDLTGWEVMYVYLMKRMGEKYGNRVQQSTKTDINELIATLTDEEKQFADTMSDTLRSIWADRVGEDRAVFNYFPIMDAEHSFFDETNIDNLKARMETDSPISIEDAGRLFSKEISRMSSWESGYYRTLKRIRDVLQYKGAEGRNIDPAVDSELKRASGILAGQIKDIFGIDGYHNILRLLDQQIADPQEQMLDSAASKTLNQMGMNVIKGLLSFKFMSLPKNMTNLAMMWGGANDQSTYWNGFAEGVGNMKHTWEYMMKHSKEIQIRYKDAGYNEFLDQRNTGGNTAPIFKGISKLFAKMDWGSDKTGGMAKMSAALDMMGDAGLKLFMLNGDAVANIYGGYGLIKDYMAQGMTEEEAFRKLDRYIVEHQSSSNLATKPLRQLEANKSLAGQLFAFTSEGVAKWASILGTFDEVQMGTATKSEAIANALSVAASMVLFAFLSAGVWDLWDDDDKVREEAVKSLEGAMIDQVFGATIMGNGFITPMIQNLAGVGGNTGISAPIWSVVSEGITNLKRGEYDRIATKAMEASGLLIGANALYNNIQGLMFMNADDPDLREAGFRMLSGRTVGYAEKRTGAKIRNRNNENVENSDEE